MPDDYMNTISKLEFHLSGDHIGSILECRDVFTANQRILDCLIEQICTEQELLNFCDWFSRIMNAPLLTTTVDKMKNDCMKVTVNNNRMITANATTNSDTLTVSTSTTAATIITTTTTSMVITPSATVITPVETTVCSVKPSLQELQNKITPYYAAHWTVIGVQLGIHSGILQGIQASFPADAFRCCNKMLEIWLDTDCNATWDKIYEAIGCPAVTKVNSKFQQEDGLTYQPPPPCPANYIPRLIINEISKVIVEDASIVENSTISIGTTVTIRGIGGIGKSTLAKALCYHPLIKKCFTHGFLWISLSPPCLNPEVVLRDMYNKLTNNMMTCRYSLLKDRIRLLFSSFPCKLLIILDDVVDANDVTEYVEVFSNCKTILTTRKNDINMIIPSKRCFDIGPMNIFEAEQLLTWQIPQFVELSDNDTNELQQLAKDLYYWPLLLSLVRGQLYIHCAEWKQSPTTALLTVRQKLQDKGLTAFDPQNVKKENAVKASINASLELLSDSEKDVLFHTVSGIGIGSCVLKLYIFKLSKVSSKEFDKMIETIWSHGLVNVGSITLPLGNMTLPCIEIHDVIAQYIIEEMPYNYHLFLTKLDLNNCITAFCSIGNVVEVTKVKATILNHIDVYFIPFVIRSFAILTRANQVYFSIALDSLIESNSDIVKTNALMKYFKKDQSLAQIYGFIKDNCRIIQSILRNNRYDEAVRWITEYLDNHSYTVLVESVQTLYNELTNECKHKPELIALVNETIGTCCGHVDITYVRNLISSIIQVRKIISEMIEAGATNTQVWEMCQEINIL